MSTRLATTIVVLPTMWSGPWIWREQRAVFETLAPKVIELPDAIVNWNAEPTLIGLDAHFRSLIEDLEPPWLLAGCSLGGLLALRAAGGWASDRVSAVVASGCPGLARGAPLFERLQVPLSFEEASRVRSRLFVDPTAVDDALLRESVEAVSERAAVRRGVRILRALGGHDPAAEAAAIDCPVLLVWGAEDQIAPAWAWRELAQRLDRFQFRLIEAVGHVPMLEAPRRFNAILQEALEAI